MISTFLKAALCGIKLIAFATILYFVLCIFGFVLFLYVMSCDSGTCAEMPPKNDISTHSAPKQPPLLIAAKERAHNQTEAIQNEILITPAPKKPKQTKAKKTNQPQAKNANKPLHTMTAKELLAFAKKHKIKGYSTIYRTQKKPGLLRLIEETSIA